MSQLCCMCVRVCVDVIFGIHAHICTHTHTHTHIRSLSLLLLTNGCKSSYSRVIVRVPVYYLDLSNVCVWMREERERECVCVQWRALVS